MKGKEIVSRVLENLATGEVTVDEAFQVEFVADVGRFQATVKERNITTSGKSEATNRIGLQAWMRLCNEYNVKWNSVCDQLMAKDGRFVHPQNMSQFVFGRDVFVHIFVGSVFRDLSEGDRTKVIQDILTMTVRPAMSRWDIQVYENRRRDEQDARAFLETYRKQLWRTA